MRFKHLRNETGITLIEILIAMTLLAFISIAVFQSTTSSYQINARLSAEATDSTALLLSLGAVEADLMQIYSPMVGAIPFNPSGGEAQVFWSAPVRSDGMRRTRFTGAAAKVSFVTNSYRRVEADSPRSDLQKITWEIDRNASNTFSLYRSSDWDAFHYEEGSAKKPERVALLENLSSGKFSFYRRSDKTWQDTWESEGAYAKDESRFPDLIRLEVEAPDITNPANYQKWNLVVRPNMTLNYLDAKARAALKQRFTE